MEIKFEQAKSLKEKPTGSLGFGKYYTDYMFVCDWDQGIGWHDAQWILLQWYYIMLKKHLKD